jgi:DNA glycosylase AlkZ-like
LRAARLGAQALDGPATRGAVDVVARLLAIQAQDDRGWRLAIRARSTGLTVADVDRELTEERSLVIGWLNRGTLHLVRSEDYAWLHALTAPQLLSGNARRLAQEGVSPDDAERGVAAVERALSSEGALTRAQLGERIAAAGVRTEGQALVHVLGLASHRGLIVRGPIAGGEQAFVIVRDWIGSELRPIDRDAALAELARRYLVGHGPADERDLARWAGVPLRDARAGLSAIASSLVGDNAGRVGVASKGGGPGLRSVPPRLLGAFDPVLLGWASREWVTGSHDRRVVSGGVFRAFALVDGRAAGLWRIRAAGGAVELEPFDGLRARDAAALEADGRDVERFLASGGRGISVSVSRD